MNKQEKIISLLLGLVLAGWLWYSVSEQKKAVEAAVAGRPPYQEVSTGSAGVSPAADAAVAGRPPYQEVPTGSAGVSPATNAAVAGRPPYQTNDLGRAASPLAASDAAKSAAPVHAAPEEIVVLENDQMSITLSTYGAVVKSATMKEYAQKPGKMSDENPAVALDFSSSPALAVEGLNELPAGADFSVAEKGDGFVVFKSAAKSGGAPVLSRRITLKENYQIAVEDEFAPSAGDAKGDVLRVSLGAMSMGSSKNDILSIDSWIVSDAKGKSRVEHHGETEPLKSYLAASSGGCSGAQSAAGMPVERSEDVAGARKWIAVKNRFFVTALVGLEGNNGFRASVARDPDASVYALKSVSASAAFERPTGKISYTFYAGPKKQSLLWELGMKDVMEFGMWRWVCYPMVWVLNLFHSWMPNYGIAIILLTFLVRIVFWPLTHKSTISMRRMSEIQPKIKEIQKKFKDNPQRMQQETFACYRENKVNPMASCLPMLVQIPVFIALFTVLRSAVELRYAPFLWISDLSEPEALGAGSWFPWFGGLNILPILMAATMALQSALTPSTGDKNLQRMMMVMMPAMMLFMFYSFPSALSLYWTLSQVISIVQMWWIRKKYTPHATSGGVVIPDGVEMPVTRQMRRHS